METVQVWKWLLLAFCPVCCDLLPLELPTKRVVTEASRHRGLTTLGFVESFFVLHEGQSDRGNTNIMLYNKAEISCLGW